MKRRIFTIILMIACLVTGFARFYNEGFYFYKTTSASGGLEVTYLGDPISGPIFDIHGMLPGDCFSRDVVATNNTGNPLELFVKSTMEINFDDLASQIDWEIKKGPTVLLSSLLEDFYDDNDGISLGNLVDGASETYTFNACFKTTAGNEFQNTMTKFNLVFYHEKGSTPNEIPAECSHLKIKKFIIGNSGNNHLFGSSQSDFIDGRGGNDHIWGLSASDCLVGGEGNDKVLGGSGEDLIWGNDGNDDLRGESGHDQMWGGIGNDQMRGGSGDDKMYGEVGNDNMFGDAGGDLMDGGPNTDTLHGGTGIDNCSNEESSNSCEI